MDIKEMEEKLQYLQKKLDETFVGEVRGSAPERLKELIVNFSQSIENVKNEKVNDNKLRVLKEQVSDLNGGYKDAQKAIELKLQYVLLTLQERGVL